MQKSSYYNEWFFKKTIPKHTCERLGKSFNKLNWQIPPYPAYYNSGCLPQIFIYLDYDFSHLGGKRFPEDILKMFSKLVNRNLDGRNKVLFYTN